MEEDVNNYRFSSSSRKTNHRLKKLYLIRKKSSPTNINLVLIRPILKFAAPAWGSAAKTSTNSMFPKLGIKNYSLNYQG
jgi:hypothetical protein